MSGQPFGSGALRQQIEGPQNRYARLDQRVQLLVKNEKIVPIHRFLAFTAKQLPQQSGTRPDVVNKKSPVGKLLAGLGDGLRGLNLQEYFPAAIRDFTKELGHYESVPQRL